MVFQQPITVQWHRLRENVEIQIKGILPKGPYLPCILAWRVGPFWQNTIEMYDSLEKRYILFKYANVPAVHTVFNTYNGCRARGQITSVA